MKLPDEPIFVAVSGGRSSGRMAQEIAAAADGRTDIHFYFNNTGREHHKTYTFLGRIRDSIQRDIAVLEFTKPEHNGGAPSTFMVRETTIEDCDRTGAPFRAMLETLRDYRSSAKGLGPVAPNASMRLCTAYLKFKTSKKWQLQFDYDCYTEAIGLRVDEPNRIAKGKSKETRSVSVWYPLADAGIDQCAVVEYWSRQPFDLDLQQHEGNCDACFLKDESDLAMILSQMSDADRRFWIGLEHEFGQLTSRGGRTYEQILAEAPARAKIHDALLRGQIPPIDELPMHRFKSIVKQEARIIREGRREFHCSCESMGQVDDAWIGQLYIFPPEGK